MSVPHVFCNIYVPATVMFGVPSCMFAGTAARRARRSALELDEFGAAFGAATARGARSTPRPTRPHWFVRGRGWVGGRAFALDRAAGRGPCSRFAAARARGPEVGRRQRGRQWRLGSDPHLSEGEVDARAHDDGGARCALGAPPARRVMPMLASSSPSSFESGGTQRRTPRSTADAAPSPAVAPPKPAGGSGVEAGSPTSFPAVPAAPLAAAPLAAAPAASRLGGPLAPPPLAALGDEERERQLRLRLGLLLERIDKVSGSRHGTSDGPSDDPSDGPYDGAADDAARVALSDGEDDSRPS